MKKSNLKYVFLTLLIGTIYSLYHYNKKYFESPTSVYQKKSKGQSGGSSGMAYASGSNSEGGSSFSINAVSGSGSIGVEVETSSEVNSSQNSNNNPSSFIASGGSFSSSTVHPENQVSSNYDQESYEYTSNTTAENRASGGVSDGLNALGIPAAAIGIPISNNKRDEDKEEKKSNEVNANQTAGGRSKFFETVSNSGGNVDLPMAPGTPDDEVPLDGGASILLILGSLMGFKKLFFNKEKSA